MRNACDYKEVYPQTGESGLASESYCRMCYRKQVTTDFTPTEREKSAEPHHLGVPSVRSQFAKSAGKRGIINILGKIVRMDTQPDKHAYHIDT
jgi:hypothetical protein